MFKRSTSDVSDYFSCFKEDGSQNSTNTSSGCYSEDDNVDDSLLVLEKRDFFIKIDKQLMPKLNMTTQEVQLLILKCKRLLKEYERDSKEYKWILRCCIESELRIQELEDSNDNPVKLSLPKMGHHFYIQSTKQSSFLCDHCNRNMVSLLSVSFYKCKDCGFVCHKKCVNRIIRICAHLTMTENRLETNICIEKGLGAQKYECAECKSSLKSTSIQREAKLCDYSGLYYCSKCHWGSACEIPARIIHNWDWSKRPVSRAAFQLLTLAKSRPLFNLETLNDKIFMLVPALGFVRKMRSDLKHLCRYLTFCGEGQRLVTDDVRFTVETCDLYSVDDLRMVKDGSMETRLRKIIDTCRGHVKNCFICTAKGYHCEICNDDNLSKKIKEIFPFDENVEVCGRCSSVYHRMCWARAHRACPKCVRLKRRATDRGFYDEPDFTQHLDLF